MQKIADRKKTSDYQQKLTEFRHFGKKQK